MDSLIKITFVSVCFCLCGCVTTKYVEKQSEPLSESVYAAEDSFNLGRLDLTDWYLAQSTHLVTPPKNRIVIKPLPINDGKEVIQSK